jgi:hypothetical protein
MLLLTMGLLLQVKNSTVNMQNMNPAFLRRRVRHRPSSHRPSSPPATGADELHRTCSLPMPAGPTFLIALLGLLAQDLGVSKTVTTKEHSKSLQVRWRT